LTDLTFEYVRYVIACCACACRKGLPFFHPCSLFGSSSGFILYLKIIACCACAWRKGLVSSLYSILHVFIKLIESPVSSMQKNLQSKLKLLSHFIFKRIFKVIKTSKGKTYEIIHTRFNKSTAKHQIRISFFNCINNCEREADTRYNSVSVFLILITHPLFNKNKNSYLSLESWNKNDAMFLPNPLSLCYYFLGVCRSFQRHHRFVEKTMLRYSF
jgi:hypothetical protein